MFKRATTETFWSKVKVEYQGEAGGRESVEFEVQFKRLLIPKARALAAQFEGQDDADLMFLREIVVSWKRVTDDDGTDVPFSTEALQQLYDIGFGGPVVQTYFRTLAKAKEKN